MIPTKHEFGHCFSDPPTLVWSDLAIAGQKLTKQEITQLRRSKYASSSPVEHLRQFVNMIILWVLI